MNMEPKLKGLTKLLVWVVVIVHLMFFLLEAVLWMRPEVHTILIDFLNNPVSSDYDLQALTLKNLFINQGFYNLFLVFAGLAGWRLVDTGNYSSGFGLILFLCFAGVGAGIILASSTKAYVLALLQALPAALAFVRLYPSFKQSLAFDRERSKF